MAGDHQGVVEWASRFSASQGGSVAGEELKVVEARVLKLKAAALLRLGRGEEATESYAAALALYQELDDPSAVAECHYGLFYLSWQRSDLRSALLHADGAARAAREGGNRSLESNALQGLLGLQYDLGDLEGSWRTLKASNALLDEEIRADDNSAGATEAQRSARARLLVFEGAFLLDEERPALSRGVLRRALEMAVGNEEPSFFRSLHLNLGQAGLRLGEPAVAREHWRLAREYVPAGEAVPTALWAHLADLELSARQPTAALVALDRALGEEPVLDWRWRLREMRGRSLSQLGREEEADQAFAQAMDDVEQMRRELGFGELQAWLLDAKREPFERRFALLAKAGRTVDAVAVFERAKARSFLDAFVASERSAAAPEVESVGPEAAADRLAALQDLLPMVSSSPMARLRPLEHVLERLGAIEVLAYFRTPEAWWAIRHGASGLGLRRLATDEEMRAAIDGWLASSGDPESAMALARLVLPDGLLPSQGTRLYLVTDGRLGEIPFAALPTSGKPLIERHALAYVPGLSALAALLESDTVAEPAPPKVLGDPAGDLPAASLEARRVAERLGVTPSLGDQAHWRPSAGSRPNVLHLATHAGLGPRGPWIALANDERLYAPQVVSAGGGPALVVLAGCSGAARVGNGVWGSMAGAFLAAGSRAVLAPLWSVDDRATLALIERFYAEGGAEDPVEALARTQRAWIANDEPMETWAGFVVLGGPDT